MVQFLGPETEEKKITISGAADTVDQSEPGLVDPLAGIGQQYL
jgi:hypothetical protein